MIPDNFIPVGVTSTPTFYVIHPLHRTLHPDRDPVITEPTDIQIAIVTAPNCQKDLLQHFRIDDLDFAIDSMQSPTTKIFSVTDRGMKDN
jgi:hypothetical protein